MNWNSQFILTFLAIGGTLAGKYVWDRWLSKSSRVTAQSCLDSRKVCSAEMSGKINVINLMIATLEIKEFHKTTTQSLKCILVTLSELCEVVDGCEDVTRERIRQEMLK